MKKIDWLIILILTSSYLILLYHFQKEIFNYRFSYNTVKRYLCSQDIPYEPSCKRVFISDDKIHQAAGYLYFYNNDPTQYNFQHPPLAKYFYGLSIYLFKNPYLIQIFFGVILIFIIYLIGRVVFNSRFVSLITTIVFIFDPLFLFISGSNLLDLPQTVFNLLYFLFLLIWKNWFLAGVFLAMFAGSKFYGAVIFFGFLYHFYLYLKNEFNLKKFILHLLTAFLVFNLFYINSYLKQGLKFNIFFLQLKVIKYWLNHSITNLPFASVLLFIFGIFKKWWGDYNFTFSSIYSFLWPISLFTNLYLLKINLINKKIFNKRIKYNPNLNVIISKIKILRKSFDLKTLINLIPPLYLLYLGPQAPFARYFVIILPFSYLGLANFVETKIIKRNS